MEQRSIFEQLEMDGSLPKLPAALTRLFSLLATPVSRNNDSMVAEVEKVDCIREIFRENPTVALLSYIAGREQFQGLRELMDSKNISALLIAIIVKRLLPQQSGRAREFDREKYWQHSLATAVAARLIAEKTRIADRDAVFAYGLIHDIGVTVMDYCLPEILDKICRAKKQGIPQINAEKDLMNGLSHEEIGGWLCEKWRLPLDVHSVVKYHHRPLAATSFVDETKMMYLADMISAAHYGESIGIKLAAKTEEVVRGHLGITQTGLAAIQKVLPEEVTAVSRLLSL